MSQTLRGTLPWLLMAAGLAALPFFAGLPGSFVFDDGYNITENAWVQLRSLGLTDLLVAAFSPEPGGHTRVLPTLSFALDYYRAGGFDAQTFKLTNIAVHVLTTGCIAIFFRRLLLLNGATPRGAQWGALALALAWALHPLQVSSVLYVVQRMQTMATLFLVLGLTTYLGARRSQIEGQSGRTGLMATALLLLLAVACKEDAVLLPAYTLALELTVLRFRAADAAVARRFRHGYAGATLLAALAFFLIVVPRHWTWEAYPSRTFSTPERLLSQARVLCLYLGQILWPNPAHMPFYYDGLQPSRGWLQPWTTLPSLLLIVGLLATAWWQRQRRPLVALGLLLFFAAHFITSNVVGLDLAYEHRNHLALAGIVLAVGSLLSSVARRIGVTPAVATAAVLVSLAALGTTTAYRAHVWRSELSLALTSTRLAPRSARAWNDLCVAWFNAGGGLTARNPHLGRATDACMQATRLNPDSVAGLVNVLTYKTVAGTITPADWSLYLHRLRRVPLKTENVMSVWVMINNVRRGIAYDEDRLLEAVDIGTERGFFGPVEFASIGYLLLGHSPHPDRAYRYFARAVEWSGDPAFNADLQAELRKLGRTAWADRLDTLARQRQ